MHFLFPSISFVGLEAVDSVIKVAKLTPSSKDQDSLELFKLHDNSSHFKYFEKHHPVIVSAIEEKELLIRQLSLPLIKKKDIEEALSFQIEPLLPYPPEEAFLMCRELSKSGEKTDLIVFSIRKEALNRHLQFWHSHQIEPEKVSTVPSALYVFGKTYFREVNNYLIIHLQPSALTISLIKEGILSTTYMSIEGLNPGDANLKKLKQETTKMVFALFKECIRESLEGIVLTGEGMASEEFVNHLKTTFSLPLLIPSASSGYSGEELLSYAVPIGLALEAQSSLKNEKDFRQQEFAYPTPWKRCIQPMGVFFGVIFMLSLSIFFFSEQYFKNVEKQIKQNYVDLLAKVGRPYDDFENLFASKNHISPLSIRDLTREELENRLSYLQQELQSSPDSFPLFPNVPRVSDVLAWLGQYVAKVSTNNDEEESSPLNIDSFDYTLVKYPQMGKKQEKYQVKIDLEFSTETPKYAREFHDALITPNDWVDSKSEIKWNANRSTYKTSFYLKDKTIYPSS